MEEIKVPSVVIGARYKAGYIKPGPPSPPPAEPLEHIEVPGFEDDMKEDGMAVTPRKLQVRRITGVITTGYCSLLINTLHRMPLSSLPDSTQHFDRHRG